GPPRVRLEHHSERQGARSVVAHEGRHRPRYGRAAAMKVAGRTFASKLPTRVLDGIQEGTLRTMYRGIACAKSPFDLALYLQLIASLRPRTVIEIGTHRGGSALWFADMLSAHRIEDPRVVSVDIEPVAELADERLTFLRGDAKKLGEALPPELLASCARPWLVVDDG